MFISNEMHRQQVSRTLLKVLCNNYGLQNPAWTFATVTSVGAKSSGRTYGLNRSVNGQALFPSTASLAPDKNLSWNHARAPALEDAQGVTPIPLDFNPSPPANFASILHGGDGLHHSVGPLPRQANTIFGPHFDALRGGLELSRDHIDAILDAVSRFEEREEQINFLRSVGITSLSCAGCDESLERDTLLRHFNAIFGSYSGALRGGLEPPRDQIDAILDAVSRHEDSPRPTTNYGSGSSLPALVVSPSPDQTDGTQDQAHIAAMPSEERVFGLGISMPDGNELEEGETNSENPDEGEPSASAPTTLLLPLTTPSRSPRPSRAMSRSQKPSCRDQGKRAMETDSSIVPLLINPFDRTMRFRPRTRSDSG
ncbi:hypothetical protein IWZ01DRAFT_487058 [Phyllosticta capitalensis]